MIWAELGSVACISGGSQIQCLEPTSKSVPFEGVLCRVKLESVAGMQGGLGRAGVLIECHNLRALLPFNIHIFQTRPLRPLFVR